MNEKEEAVVLDQPAKDRVGNEDQFVESLRQIWIPHQRRDLETRFELGSLLNKELGQPTVRQSYAMGTIRRVSDELSIDKSDISRMRRFAAKYKSFDAFTTQQPEATCWTHVRALIRDNEATDRPSDSRASWGVQRSLKSLIKTFESDHDFSGSQVNEIRQALRKLFTLAKTELDMDLD